MQFSLPFIDIIIFAIIAVYLIYRLKNILGQNTGFDKNNDIENTVEKKYSNVVNLKKLKNNNIISVHEKKIKTLDSEFSEQKFIDGAEAFFKMVIENFVKGDLKNVERFINKTLLKNFNKAIKDRIKDKEILIIDLIDIKSTSIKNVETDNKKIKISVLFETEQIKALKDRNNKIIDGNLNKSILVKDIWSFERNADSTDLNWMLVETNTA